MSISTTNSTRSSLGHLVDSHKIAIYSALITLFTLMGIITSSLAGGAAVDRQIAKLSMAN